MTAPRRYPNVATGIGPGLADFEDLGTAANQYPYTTGADVWVAGTITAFARTILDDADAATVRATLGIVSGSDAGLVSLSTVDTAADLVPYTTAANTWASTSLTSFARTILDDADAATVRTTLGVSASDAGLTSLATVDTAADLMPYTTAANTWASSSLTAFARTVLDDADAATVRATLGLVIGTNVASAESPPVPTHTVQSVCYMASNASAASTTQALGGNIARFGLHFEEPKSGHTYDAIGMFSSSGVGNNAKAAIYSCGTNGNPETLLWSSAVSSTNASNTNHIFTFAGGTWEAAGAAYKNGSSQLVLTRGQAIYIASMTDGNVTWRVLTGAQVINFGISTDTTTGYQGFSDAQTYPTFDATAVPASYTAQLPCMVLRFI